MRAAWLCVGSLMMATARFPVSEMAIDMQNLLRPEGHDMGSIRQDRDAFRLFLNRANFDPPVDYPEHAGRKLFLRGGGGHDSEEEENPAVTVLREITEYRNKGLPLNRTTYSRAIMESWRGEEYVATHFLIAFSL